MLPDHILYKFPFGYAMQILQPHQPQCMHIRQISSYCALHLQGLTLKREQSRGLVSISNDRESGNLRITTLLGVEFGQIFEQP